MNDLVQKLSEMEICEEYKSLLQRLKASGSGDLECIRSITSKLVMDYKEGKIKVDETDTVVLIDEIVCFYMKSNTEIEAVDFLLEVNEIGRIERYIDKANFEKTCLYLTEIARYISEDCLAIDMAYKLYKSNEAYPCALWTALLSNHKYKFERVRETLEACSDSECKTQLCFILARYGTLSMLGEEICAVELSRLYLSFANALKAIEPKSPEDIGKILLVPIDDEDDVGHQEVGPLIRQNLAYIIVNSFLNAGCGQDKLMTVLPEISESSDYILKFLYTHETSRITAAASLGLVMLWDFEAGETQLKRYLESNDVYVKSGALIGILQYGLLDAQPVCRLFDYINSMKIPVQIGAIMGLGIAYAGRPDKKLCKAFLRILRSPGPFSVIAFTSIALGLMYLGSANKKVSNAIKNRLMNIDQSESENELIQFLPLGLGLVYLGRKEFNISLPDHSDTIFTKVWDYCYATLLSCAHAGTGNVLKVQVLMKECEEHIKVGGMHQASAILGIAMIVLGDKTGTEMAVHLFDHLLRYGEPNIRLAVPLALGLLYISNPELNIIQMLSVLVHNPEEDIDTIMAAVFALGLIGAGTKNGRIASLLRDLPSYYENSYILRFLRYFIKIAQGFLHMGKGLLTLNPVHSGGFLVSPVGLAGLVLVLHAMLDPKLLYLEHSYMIYYMVLAIQDSRYKK